MRTLRLNDTEYAFCDELGMETVDVRELKLQGCMAVSYTHLVDSLLYLFYMIVGTAESVALVYLVMNITHTTYVPRYRTAVAILLYILISWILSFVFDRILLAPFHLASDDFAGTIMGTVSYTHLRKIYYLTKGALRYGIY